ncbi:hypothetical protein [Methanopyrus kandleri]|uniref:Uncharacterized protein n=1 Tax=Methanopyrus kandleri (strain AV19 / DSM 6324 / JCM 9639 / NBRC 100938) TaxID=190192 RepID=Q8TW64_METKA|nr:hypothetical protein [Methanopyrus kandleri]AAM02385.1 Uncharacterized protein MK1172 [Methanopyrus kandleri AV19]
MVAHRGRLFVETDGKLLGSCEASLIVTEENVVVVPREPIEGVDTSDLVVESVASRFDSAELEEGNFTPPRSRVVMTPPTAASMIDLGLALKRFEVDGVTVLTVVGPAPAYPFERRILAPEGEMTLRFEPKDPVAAEGSLRAAARAAVEGTVGETVGRSKAVRLCKVLVELNQTVGHGTLRLVPRDENVLLVLQPEEDIAEEFKDAVGKSQIGIALTPPELSAVFSGKAVVKHGKEDTVHVLDARKTIEFRAEGKGWALRAVPTDVIAGSTARVLLRTAAELIVHEGLRPE